jgi:hypothetical protein
VPLFYWLTTETNHVNAGGRTVAEMLKMNPQAKLAIVYLRLTKPK